MIRKYKATDTDTIIDVWYKATTLAHPFMTEEFKKKEDTAIREMYLPNTETWVYEKDENVIGFISMIENEVGAIFLLPAFHGQGIGKKLMDTVAEIYKELEVEVFEKNKIGRAFYDRYGFTFLKKLMHEETGEELLRLKYKKVTLMERAI